MPPDPKTLGHIVTPALVVDQSCFNRNVVKMSEARPGPQLRPHVKAFKSTALAGKLADAGHESFCAATVREIEGMASAGLDSDLLLANEVVDYRRLGRLVERGAAITVAVDSDATVSAAADGGIEQVLVDVEVGMPRCGCSVEQAGSLAELARAKGLSVRGVMGYEGHLMMVRDPQERRSKVERSMEKLLAAHQAVGGDIVSAGGTGTYAVNTWATEIQAGSYCLMDTHYDKLELPFEQALFVLATVISVSDKGWFVLDAGLKSMGMDHGDPSCPAGEVMFCSDEHTTVTWSNDDDEMSRPKPNVGDRTVLIPAHVDPTVAKHQDLWIIAGDEQPIDRWSSDALTESMIVDRWPIDLRHW